jgi:hypothetical protein
MRSNSSTFLTIALAGMLPWSAIGCGQSAVALPDAEVCAAQDDKPVACASAEEADDKPPATESFRFPDDPGGALAARVLTPGKLPPDRLAQRTWKALPAVESPTPALRTQEAPVPRLIVNTARSTLAPQLTLPEPTFGFTFALGLPQTQPMHTGDRIRTPAPDVKEPVALPVMAQTVPDRASHDDPTRAASSAAALAAAPPTRTTPAPFVRFTLPDPYEHHDAVKIRTPLAEETVPAATAPRPKR